MKTMQALLLILFGAATTAAADPIALVGGDVYTVSATMRPLSISTVAPGCIAPLTV